MKSFIITIDTEGDNLWNWQVGGAEITTENAKYLPRFQTLCDEFGFKPVWLTNYEMVKNPDYINFSRKAMREGRCEIGMHLHAVNNPPLYDLKVAHPANFPYLIEYPEEIMEEKIATLQKLLKETYEEDIVSHRAGRWAMNESYTKLLNKYGIKVDCSVTPGISWYDTSGITENSHGTDYSNTPKNPFYLDKERTLLEVPVSIRRIHYGDSPSLNPISILRYIKHRIVGYDAWLRPSGKNLKEMLSLVDKLEVDKNDYLMFMLHSSKMMPGGSPTFRTSEDIEYLYNDLRVLFSRISSFCEGKTLKEYAGMKSSSESDIEYKQVF